MFNDGRMTNPMTPTHCRSLLVMIAFSATLLGPSVHFAAAQDNSDSKKTGIEVLNIHLGFNDIAKEGEWVPLAIELISHGADFRGSLEITLPDADGIPVSMTLDNIALAQNTQEVIRHYVRLANQDPGLALTFRDESGATAFDRRFESGRHLNTDVRTGSTALILGIGSPAGLSSVEEDPSDSTNVRIDQQVINLKRVEDLPVQWFAYGAIETVVLSTDQQTVLDAFDPQRASALETWVRQGGHLVVTVASNWQVVSQGFLQSMLPATPEGIQTVGKLSPEIRLIESIAGGKVPMAVGDKGIPLIRLTSVHGKVLPRSNPEAANNPFLVEGTYGFGTVTLIGFDPSTTSFREWNDRRGFWLNILGLPAVLVEKDDQNIWNGQSYSRPDIASWIDTGLSSFADVTVVPFSSVALLILVYIALIGPIDYFVLKRVFGRLELTWITFPLIVIGVSVASYFSAYWLKGDQLRVNRIEMLDVDTTTETLRGQQFFSIFSPLIARYSVSTEPGLAVGGTWADLGMGRAPLDRWTSSNSSLTDLSHMGNNNGGGMFGAGGYSYAGPEPTAIINAPIRVWSVKSFMSQWLAKAAPNVVETDLKQGDLLVDQTGLVGSVTNRLNIPLKNAWLLSSEYAFELGLLNPGDTATLDLSKQHPLNTLLTERNAVTIDQSGDPSQERWAGTFNFLLNLTVATREKAGATNLTNQSLSSWSLKPLLDAGKLVLIGEISEPASNLWINAPPVSGKEPPPVPGIESRMTFLRIVMEPNAK